MLSAPRVITAATSEPVDLAEAKALLRIDGTDLDIEVAGYIAAARADVENTTGQRLMPQTVEILADRFADLEHLTVGPVQQIVSIAYRDQANVAQILDPAAYELFGVGIDRGVQPAFAAWPPVRAGRTMIVVRLKVGYEDDTMPADLRWALLALIRAKSDGSPVDVAPLLTNHLIGA